jgi:hypothetical protein
VGGVENPTYPQADSSLASPRKDRLRTSLGMTHQLWFDPVRERLLGEVDVEGVDVLGAEVVDVEAGVVGGLAAP